MSDSEQTSQKPAKQTSLKRNTMSRRSRQERRFSNYSTNSASLGCCFYPQNSPEREFWSDVVFITPQGTPKLSVKDVSRHSTLNYSVATTQAMEVKENVDKLTTSGDSLPKSGEIEISKAEITPIDSKDVPISSETVPVSAKRVASVNNVDELKCETVPTKEQKETITAEIKPQSGEIETHENKIIEEVPTTCATQVQFSFAEQVLSTTVETSLSFQSPVNVQTSSLGSSQVSPAFVHSEDQDVQTKAGSSHSVLPPTATNFPSDAEGKSAESSSQAKEAKEENSCRVKTEEISANCKTDECAKTPSELLPTVKIEAVKKSAETQTDLGEVISSRRVEIQNRFQATSTSEVPITIPTAVGEVVLHSPCIMSTGGSNPTVSSKVSSSYGYKFPICATVSYTFSSVQPNTVVLTVKSTEESRCSTQISVPSYSETAKSVVTTTTSSLSETAFPVYSSHTQSTVKTNTSTYHDQIHSTSSNFSTAGHTMIPISSSITTTSNSTRTCIVSAKFMQEEKKNVKNRRQAPGVPQGPIYSNIPAIVVSSDVTKTTDSKQMLQQTDVLKTNSETDRPTCQTVITANPEKQAKIQMTDILNNKPEVKNLVLVKRQLSQANTPKILRKTHIQERTQTMRRPVIKGEARQRLTKSIESLDDVVLDLDIAYEFVRRQNYRTSFIGDVTPCKAEKQTIYEDNSFGDVQTVMKHSKKENIYALPQPASFGEDTIQAVKRITDKYNTPQRWKLQAKSFQSSLQRPTTVTMAGKGNTTSQQPHIVMSAPPSLSAPYTREKARLGLFYRSYASEICICDCLADLKQRCGPNEPWLPTHTGRPLLVFNTGEGRRRRQLQLVLADSNTALPLWLDYITYLSEFRPEESHEGSKPVHQLRLSSNLRTQVFIEYYNTRAAADFYSRFLAITSDPSDTLWLVSGDRSSLRQTRKKRRKTISDKAAISQPCHFAHITHMEALRIPPELDLPFSTSRVRSRSFSEDFI